MRTYLEQAVGTLPEADWQLLQNMLRETTVSRQEYLLRAGEVCRTIWFLQRGAVRLFELRDGDEHTTHFVTGPGFFTVYHSLLTGSASELFIKTEEDCSLILLPYARLVSLYEESHALERIGRIMAERQYMGEFDRRRQHLNMNALQRYEYLEAHQPEVLSRFQQKDIASYLGITPVSLSRLRKQRARQGR